MASTEPTAWTYAGPFVGWVGGVLSALLLGRFKSHVADVWEIHTQLDQCASAAERAVRAQGVGAVEHARIFELFTLRSDLGISVNRAFASCDGVARSMTAFALALGPCDPGSRHAPVDDQAREAVISEIRSVQQRLRTSIHGTSRGRLAKFVGRMKPAA